MGHGTAKDDDVVPTLRVADLDAWSWSTQGDCHLLQAGVKGDLPGVADWIVVVSGEQVYFRGLYCLLHPFQDLCKERTYINIDTYTKTSAW